MQDGKFMQAMLKEFEKYLLVKKGISQITIFGYKGAVRRTLKKLGGLTPTHNQIENHILWMYNKNYSYSHIVNTSLAMEWYSRFIHNPIKLGRPRKPRTIVKDVLSEAEITRLIDASKNIREKAIIVLLAYSGIRNSELCNLRVCDVNLGDNMVRVIKGKGKRDRLIHISGDCTRILIEYINKHPRNGEDYFITTLIRKNQYTGGDLRKLVRKLARLADIKKRVYPHLLRHSLATNLLKRGANLNLIQRQLGHVFIESTMIYIRSFPQRIQNEYNLYIPSYL